ncbi:Uncharacterised protein [Enterobacter cloacae]|nr:Uncharacterised protein [Enterobacter cloacae]
MNMMISYQELVRTFLSSKPASKIALRMIATLNTGSAKTEPE